VGLNKHTDNKKRHIEPLLKYNWITYTIPNNPRDRNQKYQLTKEGKRLVKLLGKRNNRSNRY
jgi:ATP-dependent DNA helicase RecG